MKHNKSIQKSWKKLESFFNNKLPRSSSIRPRSSKPNESFSRILSGSRPRFRTPSVNYISGVPSSKLEQLYIAKCTDLEIAVQQGHKLKFLEYCSNHFLKRELKLSDFSLGEESGKIIGEILKSNREFVYIKLARNNLELKGTKNLLKGVVISSTIVHLDLSNNGISAEGCSFIFKTLKTHPSIFSLNLASEVALNRNKIGKTAASDLKDYLCKNPIIGVLNICGTFICEAFHELSNGLENCKSLVSLNIGNNMLTPCEFSVILPSVQDSNLLILNLANNSLGNEGAALVSNGLADKSRLEQLCLSNNKIGVKGAKSIFSSLFSNFALNKLDLSGNPIKYFSEDTSYALENNFNLKELNLSDCRLKLQAISTISKILIINKGLTALNLSCNSIDNLGIVPLCKAISKNFILKSLNLSKNKIKNSGAKTLAEALYCNKNLIELNLKENEIKDLGAEDLLDATRVHSWILRLNLEFNLIGEQHLEKIEKNLKNNIENSAKVQPRARSQVSSFKHSKQLLAEIENKRVKTLKEKEEIIAKFNKQNEKLDEAKRAENEKFLEVHEELKALKQVNFNLSKEIEEVELGKIIFHNSAEAEIKALEKKIEEVSAEIEKINSRKRKLKEMNGHKGENVINYLKNELEQEQQRSENAKIGLNEMKRSLEIILDSRKKKIKKGFNVSD